MAKLKELIRYYMWYYGYTQKEAIFSIRVDLREIACGIEELKL